MDSPDVRTPLLAGSNNGGGLPAPGGYKTDHPVFLRACHSPSQFLPQNRLVYVRGFVVAYLIASGIMLAFFKAREDHTDCSGWHNVFDFAIVTFSLLVTYSLVVSSWTFTHLYFPNIEDRHGGWEYAILRVMSVPRELSSLRKQYYFNLFYAATCVATFINTFYYWVITRPHNLEGQPEPPSASSTPGASTMRSPLGYPPHHYDHPFSDLFGEGWFASFNVINLYAVTTVIAVFEIFVLNSIKRPASTSPIVFGLILLSFLYLGWAAIGQLVTGCYAFFWLSEEEAGSRETVVAYCIIFVLMAPIMFALFYGLVGMRESWNANRSKARAAALAAQAERVANRSE